MKIKALPYLLIGGFLIFLGVFLGAMRVLQVPEAVNELVTGATIGSGAILVLWGFLRMWL